MSGPVRSLDLAELRAFCAAVDLGSLGRAARLLRVSQPALSKRMRAVEAVVGTRLVERSPRGISPTPAGTRLYVEARKLLAQAEAVDDLVRGLSGEEAPVRLAASHTIAEFVLPGPLVDFERQRDRHLSLELMVANSVVVRELVRDGRADFGIAAVDRVAQGVAPLTETPFCDDEVIVGVPADHPWARAEFVEMSEFTTTPMVVRDPSANTRRVVEESLVARGLSLAPPLAEVGSTSAAKATALEEGVPVLLSRMAVGPADQGLLVRRVKGLDLTRQFAIVTGAEETLPAGARAL
ncbi:MAG TPA: LysR family transcriptional regulator, partial [Thermoleophilaceae bacterium]|nr:LysR family transcriptional regulator [Thermoleophilaceae bacterium]